MPLKSLLLLSLLPVVVPARGALAPFVGIDVEACGKPVIVPLMAGTPVEKPAEYRLALPADHLPLGLRQLVVAADFAPLVQPYVAAATASGDTVVTLAPAGANYFDVVTPAGPNGERCWRSLSPTPSRHR